MNTHEIALMRHIKAVGLSRAHELLAFISAWEQSERPYEGEPMAEIVESEEPQSFHEDLGNRILASMPKKAGRQKGDINPNSVCQTCFRELRSFLEGKKNVDKEEALAHVQKVTGFPANQVQWNCQQCKGIVRKYGWWSLAPRESGIALKSA